MKILVTGAAGFIGQSIMAFFSKSQIDALGIDILSIEGNPDVANLRFLQVDILNRRVLKESIKSFQPEVVVHLASKLGHDGTSMDSIWENNLHGTMNVAELSEIYGVRQLIFLSTNSIWCEDNLEMVDEAHPPSFVEPYGASKHACEEFLLNRESSLKITILRAPIIMGGNRVGLFGHYFIFVKENRRLYVIGSGKNIVQIVAIEDLVSAVSLSIEKEVIGVFNLGTSFNYSILQFTQELIRHAQSHSRIIRLPARVVIPILKILHKAGLSPLGPFQYSTLVNNFGMNSYEFTRQTGWGAKIDPINALVTSYDNWLSADGSDGNQANAKSPNTAMPRSFFYQVIRKLS